MHAGAHRAFRAWRTAGNDLGKDERVEPKRRRGVAIGKKEVEGHGFRWLRAIHSDGIQLNNFTTFFTTWGIKKPRKSLTYRAS
jgi:hypothetical protein